MPDALDALAETLHAARRDDSRVPPPGALSVNDARAVQARLDALEASPVVGFKIGATTTATLELLGLDEPFVGTLRAEHHRTGDGEVRLPRSLPVRVECEIVLRVGRDVTLGADAAPPGAADPKRMRRAADAVDAAFAGLEFVGTRFELDLPGNGAALIADGGSAVATVLSDAPVEAAPGALGDLEIRLDVDGERRASGRPRDSLAGDPFRDARVVARRSGVRRARAARRGAGVLRHLHGGGARRAGRASRRGLRPARDDPHGARLDGPRWGYRAPPSAGCGASRGSRRPWRCCRRSCGTSDRKGWCGPWTGCAPPGRSVHGRGRGAARREWIRSARERDLHRGSAKRG